MSKVNKSEVIRKLYDEGKTVKEIKAKVKCSHALIAVVLRNYKNKTKKSKIIKAVEEVKEVLDKIEMRRPKHRLQATETDLVNHPPHYRVGGVETIDFIEAKDLNYRLGNVVKYVSRAGKKDSDPVQDLEKAAWYLQREIAARKNA
jgi:hypothetical protein